MDNKETFLKYIISRRSHLMRSWCDRMKELKNKRKKLEEKLEDSLDESNTKRIGEEIDIIDEELDKIREELQGSILRKCFKQIEDMKGVGKVKYYPTKIEVTTKNIEMQKKNIGRYIITIGSEVHIKRVDGFRTGGRCHPFVSSGNPCYGVWNSTISKALNNGGIYTVVVASLKLLRCSQSDYSGFYINPSEFYRRLKGR